MRLCRLLIFCACLHIHSHKRVFLELCPPNRKKWRKRFGEISITIAVYSLGGRRGWEFCTICPFFAHFSTFTKISHQVPSFQSHSPVKTIFRKNAKNARKSQNTPSTNPYQNQTQFSPLSLKSRSSRHPDNPKV